MANDQERAAFEAWFYASKYAQVAPPTKAHEQAAWDGWKAARAALAAAPVQAVPGWALVPLHATPEMVSAAEGVEDLYKRGTPQTWAAVFRAMLAAAPAAPQVPAVPLKTVCPYCESEWVTAEQHDARLADVPDGYALVKVKDDEHRKRLIAESMSLPAAPGAAQPAEPASDEFEIRKDGQRVRKDRWEWGIRRIVALLWGNRQQFEIGEVVDAVRELVPAPHADEEALARAAQEGFAPQPAERVPLTDAQIEAGRRETFSTENPFCPCDSKTMRKAVRWAEHAHGIRAAGVKEPPNVRGEARQTAPPALDTEPN